MPRRSMWKGSFVDAFLFRMQKNRESLLSKKIWSRRLLFRRNSFIALYSFTMDKLLFVVRSLKEGLVINLESLLLHCLRKQIKEREERGKSQSKRLMAREGNPISVRLDLNRSSDPSRFSEGDRKSH